MAETERPWIQVDVWLTAKQRRDEKEAERLAPLAALMEAEWTPGDRHGD